jgi:hypothetical protein
LWLGDLVFKRQNSTLRPRSEVGENIAQSSEKQAACTGECRPLRLEIVQFVTPGPIVWPTEGS